ncbi:30S ribosomal protein S3 [Candidatus Woesearchaeota archaeon]|nr:30S ribosomal protein S3 [Candidatus Woesearchaeota archaeon]
MIERGFIVQKTKEYYIKRYIEQKLSNVGVSHIRLKKIPLGEKIIIQTAKPSLIVGSKGSNIKELTRTLKKEFQLENPQIEIEEVKDIFLDPKIVAERIASSLEKFGSARFKGVGHKMMENVMKSGALGVEIILSGKIPGARAKSWRFYNGYLKKCGDVSIEGVKRAQAAALLKSGIIGIKVAIMPPDVELPDRINIKEALDEKVEEIKAEKTEEKLKKKTIAKRPKKAKEAREEKKEKIKGTVTETIKETMTEIAPATESKEEAAEAAAEPVAEEAKDETS